MGEALANYRVDRNESTRASLALATTVVSAWRGSVKAWQGMAWEARDRAKANLAGDDFIFNTNI